MTVIQAKYMKVPAIIYAATCIGGGVVGYRKNGNIRPLVAGGTSAALVLYGGYVRDCDLIGRQICAATSVALAAYFGNAYYNSKKVMPSGMMAGVSSAVALGFFLTGLL